jgi:phosphoglycerate dehydrogenase-like enzyme
VTSVLVSELVKQTYGDRLRSAAAAIDLVAIKLDGELDTPSERFDVVFLSPDMFFGAARHLFRQVEKPITWFHTSSAGVDHPAFQGLLDRGIRLTNGAGTHSKPIAQWVLMFMLAAAKGLRDWLEAESQREWRPHESDELTGRTCGIVGLGAIGLEVARLARAFEMKTIGVRRSAGQVEGVDEVLPLDRLDEMLNRSDFVVVAAPLNDESRGMIGAHELEQMKPSAWLLNVGRGPIIDQPALIEALQQGTIAGAALDVFEKEPLPEESPLWSMPNVYISPHNSGSTPFSLERAVELFAENLRRFAAGDPLLNEVSGQQLAAAGS